MSQTSIKTILSVDDKDVKSKLDSLKKHHKETFDAMKKVTNELIDVDHNLSAAKTELRRMQQALNEEKAKGVKADQAILAGLKASVVEYKEQIRLLNLQKGALGDIERARKRELQVTNEAIKSTRELNQTFEQQWNHLIRMARWGGTIVGVYYGISRVWSATIGVGIQVNRVIEDNTNGIAALITANTTGADAATRFAMSQQIAAATMTKLRKAATETAGTFSDMVLIYQQGFAQTISMGSAFGKNIDEISNNTIKLTQRMMNIAGAMGMPMDRVREEIRSLLSANASTDSLIATMLFGSPSQANNAVKKAKELGDGALNAMLSGKLSAFDVLAQADTYTKQLSRAQDAYEQLAAAISKPVFSDMKELFGEFANVINSGDVTTLEAQVSELYKSVKSISSVLLEVAVAAASFKAISWAAVQVSALSGAAGAAIPILIGLRNGTIATTEAMVALRAAAIPLAATIWPVVAGTTALIGAYEAYNKLIVETAKYESDLDKALRRKINTIGDLTTSQIKSARATLDLAIQAKSLEYSQARAALGADTGSTEKRATKDTVRAEYENLLAMRQEYNKVLQVKLTAETALTKQKEQQVKYNDILKRSGLNTNLIEEAGKYRDSHTPVVTKTKEFITALEGQLAIARKEHLTDLVKDLETTIAMANSELDKEGVKAGKKAATVAAAEARIDRAKFDRTKQQNETELAYLEYIESQKYQNFKLDESRLTDLQKRKLTAFEQEATVYAEMYNQAQAIPDATDRQVESNKILEQLYKSMVEFGDYRLRIQKGINDELDAENAKLDKAARIAMERANAESLRTAIRAKNYTSFSRTFGEGKLDFLEGQDLIAQASSRFSQRLYVSPDEKEKALRELEDYTKDIEDKIAKIPDFEINLKVSGWDEFSNGVADLINSFKLLNKASSDYVNITDQISKRQKVQVEGSDEWVKLEKQKSGVANKFASDQIDNYSAMAAGLAAMYGKESSEAKKLHEVEKALAMSKMAINVAQMLSEGTLGIATQSKLPFPANLAAMAGTAAALASFGVMLGGGSSVSSDTFASKQANTGTGSVLGDSSAQSESIANSIKIMSDLAKPEYRLTSEMAKSLQSIDNKMASLSANIARVGGFATGEGYVGSTTDKTNYLGTALLTGGAGAAMPALNNVVKDIPLIGDMSNLVTNAVGSIVGGVFGGKTTRSLEDAGITFDDQLITAAMTGLEGQSYQVVKTVKDGGWFGKDKTSLESSFAELDEYTRTQFQLVLGNLYDITVKSAEALNTSSSAVSTELDDFVVSLGKISLKGKTGDEIQETLTAVFGNVADAMAEEAYPALSQFQQIGEGVFETLTRVATGMQEAQYLIDDLGVQYQAVNYLDIENKRGDVALEALSQAILRTEQAGSGITDIVNAFTGSATDLFSLYSTVSKLRTVMGKDIGSEMLRGAGGADQLSDAWSSFSEAFMSDTEQFNLNMIAMNAEFTKLGVVMPSSNSAFRSLVESIDTTTDSGQELYGRLLLLSDQFDSLTAKIEALFNAEKANALELASLQRQLTDEQTQAVNNAMDAVRRMTSALTSVSTTLASAVTSLQTGGNQSSRQLISTFWSKREQAEALLRKGDLSEEEQSQLQTLASDLGSIGSSIQSGMTGETGAVTNDITRSLQELQNQVDFTKTVMSVNVVGGMLDIGNVSDVGLEISSWKLSDDQLNTLSTAIADGNISAAELSQLSLTPEQRAAILTTAENTGIEGKSIAGILNSIEIKGIDVANADEINNFVNSLGLTESQLVNFKAFMQDGTLSPDEVKMLSLTQDQKAALEVTAQNTGDNSGTTVGVLSALKTAIDTYNSSITSALASTKEQLTFSDFAAGGLLSSADEIAFRQSFKAESATTFKTELEALRENLSYMALSTTDLVDFLTQLGQVDPVGYGNVIEFLSSMGDVPSNITSAFQAIEAEAERVRLAPLSSASWEVGHTFGATEQAQFEAKTGLTAGTAEYVRAISFLQGFTGTEQDYAYLKAQAGISGTSVASPELMRALTAVSSTMGGTGAPAALEAMNKTLASTANTQYNTALTEYNKTVAKSSAADAITQLIGSPYYTTSGGYKRYKLTAEQQGVLAQLATTAGHPGGWEKWSDYSGASINTNPAFLPDIQAIAALDDNLSAPVLQTKFFANGGIVSQPTFSIFGERGAEAFVPLPDGRTIPVTMRGNEVADYLMGEVLSVLKEIKTSISRLDRNIDSVIISNAVNTTQR